MKPNRTRIVTSLSISLCLLLTTHAWTQVPTDIQNVKSWRVTYTVSAISQGAKTIDNMNYKWDFNSAASGVTDLTTEDGRNFSGTNNTRVQGGLTSKKTIDKPYEHPQ